jgi:type III restriction enzyme
MTDRVIDHPIINSPYHHPPTRDFTFDRERITNRIEEFRRPSEYFVPVPHPKRNGQQLEFAELTADDIRVNDQLTQVRGASSYGSSGAIQTSPPTTRRLLEYRNDPDRDNLILFCQREAAQTAIYLVEAAQKSGDAWIRNALDEANHEHTHGVPRLALKMATSSGKTVVMAMIIAWQTLNKVAGSTNGRFAKRFLVVTPGITVRDRLRVGVAGRSSPSGPDRGAQP